MCIGFGAYSRFSREPSHFPFEHVKQQFLRRDVVFANLECTHSAAGLRKQSYASAQLRGAPRHISALSAARINLINVANNHSYQHGARAFRETVDLLQQNGVAVCGLSDDTGSAARLTSLQVNGMILGVLAYSLRPRQYFTQKPLYAEGNRERILADVRKATQNADVLVVSLHWGAEFIQKPALDEIELAREIADSGAHLVVGHHPHVLRGTERRGNGFIAYSMGNFVADMPWHDSLRTTAILHCDLSTEGATNIAFQPCFINDDYQPIPLDGLAADKILARLDNMSLEIERTTTQICSGESLKYVQQAARTERRISFRAYWFFALNAGRYPQGMVAQKLITFFKNRLREVAALIGLRRDSTQI